MSTTKHKNRRTSPIWNFFVIIDKQTAACTICKNKVSYKSSVTNLKKHLQRKHYTSPEPNVNITNINDGKLKQEPISAASISSEGKRRRTSPLWNFFDIVDDVTSVASCTLCKREVSYRSSVTNLKRHLERKHCSVRISKLCHSNTNKREEQSTSNAIKENDTEHTTIPDEESYGEDIIYLDYSEENNCEETSGQPISTAAAPPKLKKYNKRSDTSESGAKMPQFERYSLLSDKSESGAKIPQIEGCTLLKKAAENKSPEQDEIDAFVALLGKKLKKFNEDDREVVMNEIDNFIFQKRIASKRDPIAAPPTPSPSSNSNGPP